MKAKISAAVAALMAISAVTGMAFAQDDPITLTISAFSTSNSPNHKRTIDKMIADIEEKSDGKVKFETYFGGSAYGNAQRQYEQVQRGVVDISHGLFGYTPGRFPMVEILELPFLYEDSVAASAAFWLTYEKYLKDELPGVKPIAIWLTSMQQLHVRQPVQKMEDLSGLKIRAGGPSMVKAMAALGAEGIVVPAPAIYEQLQKGVLDGAIGAWGMLKAFNVGEVTSHHLGIKITAAPLFVLMNEDKYNSLPDDVKALFDAYSTVDTVKEFASAFTISDKIGTEIASSDGHQIIELSGEELARWKAATKPIIDNYLEELEARGMPARAFYDDFLAELERQKAQ